MDSIIPILPSQIAELREKIKSFSPKDQGFISSLLSAYDKGKATPNQIKWLGIMHDKLGQAAAPAIAVGDDNKGFLGVYKLFEKASANLKFPKIKLLASNGQRIVLSVAGSKSKYVGKIMVTDGKPYGENKWFGSIDIAGLFKPSSFLAHQPKDYQDSIVGLLCQLAEKPAEVASVYGKMTGHCCFCGLALSDPASVAVGYGPICAGHYGLPHGNAGVIAGVKMFKPEDKLDGSGKEEEVTVANPAHDENGNLNLVPSTSAVPAAPAVAVAATPEKKVAPAVRPSRKEYLF